MKAGLYLRVSLEEQARTGYSIPDQENKGRTYCTQHDHELIKVYKEEGESGSELDRTRIKELIQDIKNGTINCVIVIKIDRLTRSSRDSLLLLDWFAIRGTHLISIYENVDGLNTPSGRLIYSILANAAQYEREKMLDLTINSLKYRVINQKQIASKPPFGYTIEKRYDEKSGKNKAVGHFKIVPDQAGIIKEIYNSYIAGEGLEHIGKKYNKHPTAIKRILTNRTYLGEYQWGGQAFPDWHPSIIQEATWLQAQGSMRERPRPQGWRWAHRNKRESLRVELTKEIETNKK